VEVESTGASDRNESMIAALDQAYGELRTEWGAAYDSNYARVNDVLRDAPESVIEAYKSNTLPPEQVKWLHSLAELADETVEVNNQKGKGVLTPEQAALELEEFKPMYYAMKKHDPGYKAAQAKFERLLKLRMGLAA